MSKLTRISWSQLLIVISGASAVVTICGALYLREADQIAKSALDREARRTEIFAHFYEQDLQATIKDLRQLVDGDGLQAFLLSKQQSDLGRALHRAEFYSRLNADYDQVRYLDEKGQEVIRVNANGEVVPPDKLQNRADRPYFQETNALEPGQFFISAFDLNVEHQKIEQPIKPMLRIATPVFDANGRRCGIYIINYLGGNLISRLQQFAPQYQQRLRMLNAQGYWLKAAKPEQEWGFMFSEGKGKTLTSTEPSLWEQVAHQPEGQLYHANGVFTWFRITLEKDIIESPQKVKSEDDFLVMASEITPEEWSAYFVKLRETFGVLAVVLLLLAGASWQFFKSRQRAQRELDRFFSLNRDMLCIAGFDGYFKRVNSAWSSTLGYTQAEMLAKPFLEFVHPDDRVRTILQTENLIGGGETIAFENRYICKDGSYRWLSWSATPLIGEDLIFGSARDLTEQKIIDEQILKLNVELKRRASELEVANKELEAFSYSVSHDLRAPLRHIHGFVELLQKSPAIQTDPTCVRPMKVIAKAARDMGMLIDDLLAFSRTGRAEMHLISVDTKEIVDQAIHELEIETKNRKITWNIQTLPKVSVDPTLFRLVWTNLISNALKYTRPRDEAKIEIGYTLKTDVTPEEMVFHIRDNGVGFDMQYASKLFGVFQRLHRPEDFEGTGIGLANVQRIIHRHGGRVWVEAAIGTGATFYFSIPITSSTMPPHA